MVNNTNPFTYQKGDNLWSYKFHPSRNLFKPLKFVNMLTSRFRLKTFFFNFITFDIPFRRCKKHKVLWSDRPTYPLSLHLIAIKAWEEFEKFRAREKSWFELWPQTYDLWCHELPCKSLHRKVLIHLLWSLSNWSLRGYSRHTYLARFRPLWSLFYFWPQLFETKMYLFDLSYYFCYISWSYNMILHTDKK